MGYERTRGEGKGPAPRRVVVEPLASPGLGHCAWLSALATLHGPGECGVTVTVAVDRHVPRVRMPWGNGKGNRPVYPTRGEGTRVSPN